MQLRKVAYEPSPSAGSSESFLSHANESHPLNTKLETQVPCIAIFYGRIDSKYRIASAN